MNQSSVTYCLTCYRYEPWRKFHDLLSHMLQVWAMNQSSMSYCLTCYRCEPIEPKFHDLLSHMLQVLAMNQSSVTYCLTCYRYEPWAKVPWLIVSHVTGMSHEPKFRDLLSHVLQVWAMSVLKDRADSRGSLVLPKFTNSPPQVVSLYRLILIPSISCWAYYHSLPTVFLNFKCRIIKNILTIQSPLKRLEFGWNIPFSVAKTNPCKLFL